MHIQIYDNTLNKEECESIIEYFDRSPYKSKGLTSMGNNQYGIMNLSSVVQILLYS